MLLFATLALALDAKKVPTQDIFLDDGQSKSYPATVEFAVLGNVRPGAPGEAQAGKRVATPNTTAQIVSDLSATIQEGRTEFIVLLGDMVPSSSVGNWKDFTKTWVEVLAGGEPPEGGKLRVRSVPVAGEHEAAGDDRYVGMGAAFPGMGADIGYGRVASWYHFDLDVAGHTWRFVAVDTDKATLGSRWTEQNAYLETVLTQEQDDYDSVLVFMHHPLLTLALGQVSNEGDAASDLLATIDGATKIGALKAVFASHSHTSEVFLPRGKFSELYVNAGGGGAPADSLDRWGHAEAGGFPDLKLETTYDFALMREFDKQAEARKCPQAAIDHAKSSASWAGFPGEYEAGCMPVQGWWDVSLTGEKMSLTWRQVQPDGTLRPIYTADYAGRKAGWTIGK